MATSAEDIKKKLDEQGSVSQPSQSITSENAGGIISSAQSYKAPETKPVTTQVDAGQETVEDRLNKLTATGSNYTNLAKQDAMRSANDRGLINSSIAAGAGTEAAIRSALPIAQQDAKTYTDTRMANQNTENDFLKNRQSADLNMETAAQGSALQMGQANNQSGLTQAENQQLNDLQMKRDSGQSVLTREEQSQLNDLQMKRDVASSELSKGEAKWQSELDMTRDTNSTELNKSLEILQSSLRMDEEEFSTNLKTQAEQILNDAKFSDEIKLQYVGSINTIVRDTQQQITDIGLSDRTAAQQAAAIQLARDSRDAQVAVYQDLLSSFPDWTWSLDFTQGVQGAAAGGAQGAVAANQAEDQASNTSQRTAIQLQIDALGGSKAESDEDYASWSDRRNRRITLEQQLAAIPA